MEARGTLKDVLRTFEGKWVLTFEVSAAQPEALQGIAGKDLDITAKEHREKRSLNANSYFHLLVQRIAEAVNAPMTEVKNHLIREYGAFEYVDDKIPTFKLKAEYEADMLNREGLHVKPIGRDFEGGVEWVRFAFMRGSHTYNTAEMSRLIDGTVMEAKQLGIETLTPEMLERMKASWGNGLQNRGE